MRASNVAPLFNGLRVAPERSSAAERVVRAHRIVEDAARELDSGDPGSGLRVLGHAMATHYALCVGCDAAESFFRLLAQLASDTHPVEPGDVCA